MRGDTPNNDFIKTMHVKGKKTKQLDILLVVNMNHTPTRRWTCVFHEIALPSSLYLHLLFPTPLAVVLFLEIARLDFGTKHFAVGLSTANERCAVAVFLCIG